MNPVPGNIFEALSAIDFDLPDPPDILDATSLVVQFWADIRPDERRAQVEREYGPAQQWKRPRAEGDRAEDEHSSYIIRLSYAELRDIIKTEVAVATESLRAEFKKEIEVMGARSTVSTRQKGRLLSRRKKDELLPEEASVVREVQVSPDPKSPSKSVQPLTHK